MATTSALTSAVVRGYGILDRVRDRPEESDPYHHPTLLAPKLWTSRKPRPDHPTPILGSTHRVNYLVLGNSLKGRL